jgi:prolyl oligopeptidase
MSRIETSGRLLAGGLMMAASLSLAQPALPPSKPASETFFGTEVGDPYRNLEDTKSPEVAAWMKAQSAYTHKLLSSISGRDAIYQSLLKYEGSVPARVIAAARETGDLWFYERRGADENQFKLLMREGLAGQERLLVDPEAVEKRTGKPHAINYYAAAPGGGLVAYGLSAAGSEAAVLHLIDTRNNSAIGKPIDRTDFGAVGFTPDGRVMFFNRLQQLKKGMAPTEKYQRSQVLMLKPGDDVARAVRVFGIGVRGVNITPAEIPVAGITYDGKWALGLVFNGTQRELTAYTAPAQSVLAGKPQWKKVIDPRDEVTGVAYMHDQLTLLTHKDAPRSKVIRIDLAKPDLANAQLLMAPSERVVTGVVAAADALYFEVRDGNVKRLFKRPHSKEGDVAEVKLPLEGAFELTGFESNWSAADPRFPGVVLDLQSWTRARQIYLVGADGSVKNTGLQPQGPYDAPADIVATEVMVKSHDGALVPMSIIHKRGTQLNGNNPTILYGYASYGITEEPFYSVTRLAWLEVGGVYAIANPRGSGVFGQDWYKAGFQATKPNTWKDFIACAEYLIAQKWTSPSKLGIFGGSAGGILVGRAMTERPDLFAAAVPLVGVLDMVRAEVTPNGVPNIPEFGTRKNEAGFRALLAMSTYHHIEDGRRYPAVLFTHGVNDPRVEVWHSTKTAARLTAAQAALKGEAKPVLLRLDYEAGHGVGSTKTQVLHERADILAFFLWQMGTGGYAPQAKP